jgi:flagellar biosynthesis protein FlhB
MADHQDADRSEPATPHKLEKARERGSIVRSGELMFVAVLVAACACLYGLGQTLLHGLARLLARGLAASGAAAGGPGVAFAGGALLAAEAATLVAPAVFVVWLAAVLAGAVQARGVFSAHPLKPDFTRLSPGQGLKRLVAIKSLHDAWRNVAKLGALGLAALVWGQHHAPALGRLLQQTPRAAARSLLELFGSALAVVAAVLFAFALVDWAIQRWQFARQMRMSRREIRDEHKEREGDPRIKTRLRELRLQWLQRARQIANVRDADVVVTNPTHYAVALAYRHGTMPAPQVTARGAGELALKLRLEARRHGVPIVENPPLARALFALQDGQPYVPSEHFAQVARILRWVFAARGNAAGAAP